MVKNYSCEEFMFHTDYLITTYFNTAAEDHPVKSTTTWKEKGGDETYTYVNTAQYTEQHKVYTVTNKQVLNPESRPVRMKINKKKYYDITIVLEHEPVSTFGMLGLTTNRDVIQDIVDPDFVTENGGYMTVQYGDDEPEAKQCLFVYDAVKYCNSLFSGTVTMTDENGNTVNTDTDGSDDAKVIQPNQRPVVRLYDLNDDRWLQIAHNKEQGNYISATYNENNYANTGVNRATYYVKADSTVAHHEFTNNNNLEGGGYYCEMEIDGSGNLSFNSGPIDFSHTYALVVASSTAGWAGSIFNFEEGEIKPLSSMQDITDYVNGTSSAPRRAPALIDRTNNAHINNVQVDVTIKLEPGTYTAVEDIEVSEAVEAVYYDLSGRKASAPFNGVNIVKRGNKVTKEVFAQ